MSLLCLSATAIDTQSMPRRFTPKAASPAIQIRGTILAVHPGVTLRIGTRRDGSREVVTVDGRLDSDTVAELERVVLELSPPVFLDLIGLKSADEAGLGVLRALLAHGVAVTAASPYVRLLLELEEPKKLHGPSQPGGRKRISE